MTDKIKAVGSKAEVFHGTAKHTPGGLFKKDLMKTRKGRIVSKKQHASGKKAIKRLFSLGYKPKKGKFSLFRKGTAKATRSKKTKRTTRRRRGGGSLQSMNDDMFTQGTPMIGINKAQGLSATAMPIAWQAGKV